MKAILKVSTVLSWINLIFWGLIFLEGVLFMMATGSVVGLILSFLVSAFILHSYAVLRLRKSLRNAAVPLGNQTPTGIRFMGIISLLFGVIFLAYGIACVQHPKDILQMMIQSSPMLAKDYTEKSVRIGGTLAVLIGLSVVVNVNLSFRLLRWYYFLRDNTGK